MADFLCKEVAFDPSVEVAGKIEIRGAFTWTPKAVILIGIGYGFAKLDHSRRCFGIATGSGSGNQGYLAGAQGHNLATTASRRRLSDAACLARIDHASGTVEGEASFSAFVAGGCDLTVLTSFPGSGARFAKALFLGGDALTNAEVVTTNVLPTVDGLFNFTGFSFDPDCVISLAWGDDDVLPATSTRIEWAIGCFVRPGTERQAVSAGADRSGVGTTESATHSSQGNYGSTRVTASGGGEEHCVFDSWPTNALRCDLDESNDPDNVLFLALKGGDYSLKTLTTLTTIVGPPVAIPVTTPSRPAGGLVMSGFRAADAYDAAQVDDRLSCGVWSNTSGAINEGEVSVQSVDGRATSHVTVEDGAFAYVSLKVPATPGVGAWANIQNPSATGFDFVQATNDPVASQVWLLTFGPAPTPAPPAAAAGGKIADPTMICDPPIVT